MENVKQTNGQSYVPTIHFDVYDGAGTINLQGEVTYHISLPLTAAGRIKIQKIIPLPDDVLFIWIHGGNEAYENPKDERITLQFNLFQQMGQSAEIKKSYTIHLYHDDTISSADLEQNLKTIINKHCKTSNKALKGKDIPEQCGNGVLTLQ